MKDKETALLSRIRYPRLPTLLFLTIFVAGTFFTWWTVTQTDRKMRESLLLETHLVARSVDFNHLRSLSGTAADLDNPHYLRLKEQLTAVRSANPLCRFVYFMGRKADGSVFFFVDSEPVHSKDYSPPGQPYTEVSENYRRVFDSKIATVEGPVTDRWGMWVSALDPVIDPKTNTLIAVLGMDIDARVWKWNVAAKVAQPVGFMLVLLIGLATGFISNRRVKASPKPVMRRLLVPLATLVIVFTAIAGFLLWQQQRQRLADSFAADMADVSNDLQVALHQQSSGLEVATQAIATDPRAQKALREGNIENLLAVWSPIFETLRRDSGITHFYFLDKNRVCLLRVHRPENHGDRIDRFTALEAERTGKASSGVELGTLGTFPLRVVQPVFEAGTLVGYVELGKEIEDILRTLYLRSGKHLTVTIQKQLLNRQNWEESMRLLGREPEWDRLSQNVVLYTSFGKLPDAFVPLADQGPAGEHIRGDPGQKVTIDGNEWRVSALPLADASGKEVGHLIVTRDLSTDKENFSRPLILGGMSALVLMTLILGFIYILLRHTDTSIQAQQSDLRKSEARFRSYFDLALTGIAITSPTKGWIQVNDQVCSLLGYSREELVDMTWAEMTYPDDLAEDVAQFNRLLSGEIKQYDLEKRFVRKNGAVIWVDLAVGCVRDPQGNVEYVVALLNDISQRKKAEDLLRDSKERFDQIAALSSEMIWETDAAGLYTYLSQSCKKVIGYEAQELVGKKYFYDLHPEEGREVFRKITLAVFERKGSFRNLPNQVQAKDGRILLMITNGVPLLDSQNNLTGYRGSDRDMTEIRQADVALRSKTALLEAQTNASLDGILVVDEKQQRVLTNQRMLEIFNVPQHIAEDPDDAALLKYVVSLTRDPDSFLERVRDLYNHPGETSRDEIEFKNGMVLDRYSAPVWGKDGKYYGRIWTFRDITERKRAEEALRESQVFLQETQRIARLSGWKANPLTDYLEWTEGVFEIIEYPKGNQLGLTEGLKFYLPEYVPKIKDSIARCLATGERFAIECRGITGTGRMIWTEVRGIAPVVEGERSYVLGTFQDITERKQAEEKLALEQLFSSALLENMNAGVIACNEKSELILFNRTAREWHELSAESSLSQENWAGHYNLYEEDGITPLDVRTIPLLRAFRGEKVHDAGMVIAPKGGPQRHVIAEASPIKAEDGRILGAVAVMHDITEQLKAIQEKEMLIKQLMQAQKMESIGTMANGIAHNFNNILASIRGCTEMALGDIAPGSRTHKDLLRAIEGVDSAKQLIGQMLSFSRAQERDINEIEIYPVVANTLKLFRASVKGDIQLRENLAPHCGLVRADPNEIQHALLNILSNSYQALDPAKEEIITFSLSWILADEQTAKKYALFEGGDYVKMTLEDTGRGMDPKTLDRIFEPFFTTKEIGEGTGLGLFMTHNVVARYNGKIAVESEVGKGTVVSIFLPRVAAHA